MKNWLDGIHKRNAISRSVINRDEIGMKIYNIYAKNWY